MNYNNIKVCEDHEKVHIPDNLLTKLWNGLFKVLCVVGPIALTFTSCSGEKDVKKNIEETTIPKVETKVDKNAYNDIEDKIVIPERESTTLEEYEETTTSRGTEAERPVNKEENGVVKYNELLNKMNAELAKKNFSKEANQAFKRVLDKLYKNYPTWQGAYKDLPPVEEYIQNNLIDTIKNINSITIYDAESEIGKKLLEQGQALGQTDSEGNITMIFKGGTEENDDIERTFHEIIHCKQIQILFNQEYFKDNEELRLLMLEGSTTFHQKFVNPLDVKVGGTWTISNEAGTSTLNYNKDNCLGYLVELNAFENLVYLAGYDTMDKVEKGEISLSELKETIAKNYGQDKSNKIWNTMHKWYSAYNENWQSDEAYQAGIELQNLYLECVEQDINKLKPNQVKQFMDVYRNYKLKNLAQIENSNGENITNQVFDIDKLDDLMVEKVMEANEIYFTPNKEMNKMAIKSVLYASNKAYYDTSGIYEDVYLPTTIKGTNYKYAGNGNLIITYTDKYGETINVGITFDENSIKEIKEIETRENSLEI